MLLVPSPLLVLLLTWAAAGFGGTGFVLWLIILGSAVFGGIWYYEKHHGFVDSDRWETSPERWEQVLNTHVEGLKQKRKD